MSGVGVGVCEIGVGFIPGVNAEGRCAGVCEMGVGFIASVGVCEMGVGFSPGVDGEGPCAGVWEVGVCETGVIPCPVPGVCETGCTPPVCFFARPGGMQPDDPGEQPHPVLLP